MASQNDQNISSGNHWSENMEAGFQLAKKELIEELSGKNCNSGEWKMANPGWVEYFEQELRDSYQAGWEHGYEKARTCSSA